MDNDKNKFDPKNHEYTEHPTYTGPNCAHCGKPKEGHMEKKAK